MNLIKIMVIKNNLTIFFESIYNLYNHSYSRINNYNNYLYINNQFQIIYNINTESKFDIQNKICNKTNINNIIINNNLDINYDLIIRMIIIIFDLLLILIKRILNEQNIIKDKIKIKKQSDSNINKIILISL